MIKIGVTGNIASGKSEVEKILKDKGYTTFCADIISHSLLENDEYIKGKVFEKFKTINRKELGSIIFKDRTKKQELENIIHPKIKEVIYDFFTCYKNQEMIFVFVPLLFEADMADMFDKIILIRADEKIRQNRLIKRNNFTKDEALLRIQSQMPEENKAKYADFIIDNKGTLEDLRLQTENILGKLKQH